MTRIRVLVLLVALSIVVAILFVLGRFVSQPETQAPISEPAPEEAETREPVLFLSGTVKDVGENSFTLAVQPFGEGEKLVDERTVVIGPDTVITLSTIPDPEGAKKEMEAFQKKMEAFQVEMKKLEEQEASQEEKQKLIPPLPPTSAIQRKTVAIDALEPGQPVSIVAETDIRTEKTFTPKTVEILPAPEATGA